MVQPGIDAVLAGTKAFAVALLAPVATRLGTRPRVAADPAQILGLCRGPRTIAVVEFLGEGSLSAIQALVRDGQGLRVVAGVPPSHLAAEQTLRALGVEVASWDGKVDGVIGALDRVLSGMPSVAAAAAPTRAAPAAAISAAPRARPAGATPPGGPRPAGAPISAAARPANGGASAAAIPPAKPPPAAAPRAAPAAAPAQARTASPLAAPPRAGAAGGLAAPRAGPPAPAPQVSSATNVAPVAPGVGVPPAAAPRAVPSAAPARPSAAGAAPRSPPSATAGRAAPPAAARPAPPPRLGQAVVQPAASPPPPAPRAEPPSPAGVRDPVLTDIDVLFEDAEPAAAPPPASPPELRSPGVYVPPPVMPKVKWPADGCTISEAEAALRRALEGEEAAGDALLTAAHGVLGGLSDLERAVLAGVPQAVDVEPIRAAAVMRVRVASALASVPVQGGGVDGAAVSGMLGEIDELLARVGALVGGADAEVKPSLESIRNALVREAIDFSEAAQRVGEQAPAAEAPKPIVPQRAAQARVLSVARETEADRAERRRGVVLGVVFGIIVALALGYHGYRFWRRSQFAPAPPPFAVPAGFRLRPAPATAPIVLQPSGEAIDRAALQRFREAQEAQGKQVFEMQNGCILAVPQGVPPPIGVKQQ